MPVTTFPFPDLLEEYFPDVDNDDEEDDEDDEDDEDEDYELAEAA